MYATLHDLIFHFVPPLYIQVGPAEILIAIGLTWGVIYERRQWSKYR